MPSAASDAEPTLRLWLKQSAARYFDIEIGPLLPRVGTFSIPETPMVHLI